MIKIYVNGGDIWTHLEGDVVDAVEDTGKAIHAIYSTLQTDGSGGDAQIYRERIIDMLTDQDSVAWNTDGDTKDVWMIDMDEFARQMGDQ